MLVFGIQGKMRAPEKPGTSQRFCAPDVDRPGGLMNKGAMPIFDHVHPKFIEATFSFPKFVPACKKSVYSICSFLRYSQF